MSIALHLDLNYGVTASGINSSLLGLLKDADVFLKQVVKELHETKVEIKYVSSDSKLKENALQIFWQKKLLSSCSQINFNKDEWLDQIAAGKIFTKESSKAIFFKIRDQFLTNNFDFNFHDFLQVIVLLKALEEINPSFITASTLYAPWHIEHLCDHTCKNSIFSLNKLLTNLPYKEVDEEKATIDFLGVAIIKSLIFDFGTKDFNKVQKISFGSLQSTRGNFILCAKIYEYGRPTSANDSQPQDKTLHCNALYLAKFTVSATENLTKLMLDLSGIGAFDISHSIKNLYQEGSKIEVTLQIDKEQRYALLQYLLAFTEQVLFFPCERYASNKVRAVVPTGFGNKIDHFIVNEYKLGEEILRVEPDYFSISKYKEVFGVPFDVARSDLLDSWRTWRQKKVDDDTKDKVERKHK